MNIEWQTPHPSVTQMARDAIEAKKERENLEDWEREQMALADEDVEVA